MMALARIGYQFPSIGDGSSKQPMDIDSPDRITRDILDLWHLQKDLDKDHGLPGWTNLSWLVKIML